MKKFLILIFSGLLPFLGGCVATWTQGGADFTSSQNYRLRMPPDWIYHPNINGNFIATKDGVFLQQIIVRKIPLATPLENNHRVLSASLSPFEIAEAMTDDLKSDRTLLRLVIKENLPAKIGGVPGFKLVFDYHTADGMHLNSVRYVCVHAGYLYVLIFTAPTRHYFEHDLPGYEEMVRSFVFTTAPKPE